MEQVFVRDIVSYIEKIAPRDSAEEWDHVGLMIGDLQDEVSAVVLSLDMTPDAIDLCMKTKSNLLITHHPIFYAPCRCIDFSLPKGRLIRDVLKGGIHVYSAHTNLDRAIGGVNDALAECLDLAITRRIEAPGIGIIAQTQSDESFFDFADKVKNKLNATGVFLNSQDDVLIKKVAVCAGSFSEESIEVICASNVDLVITGEMKHHHMIDFKMRGIRVIVAGHGATEQIILPKLKNYLLQELKSIEVSIAPLYC